MAGDVSAMAGIPPELPERIYSRRIRRNLPYHQRLSLWIRNGVQSAAERYSHRKIHNRNRCAFCADPRIKDWFKGGYYDKTSELKMDRIPSMISRRDTCIICSVISTIVARRDQFDPDQDVFLKSATFTNGISVFVKGKGGDCEEIGTFGSYSNRPDRFLLLQEPERLGSQPVLTINRSVSEKIVWPVVKEWFQDSPKKDDLDHYPIDFRLIDVESLCVVRARKPCEYVCLSYVWGKDTSYQATLDNIRILEQQNSLGTWDSSEQRSMIEGSDVPATIKDAIVACYALGKRYLWVDRLCILQDEDEENNPSKKEQINAMGDIYRCAFVTLVALQGSSSTHGLPGVSLNRVPQYQVFTDKSGCLDSKWGFQFDLHGSVWNRRGWTYQEAILSPRLLFFTKQGLWYEDDRMNRMKADIQEWATAMDVPHFHWISSDKSSDGGLRYSTAVEMITEREFGYEWDILNGFSGVLNSFFGKHHRFAIPLEDFDCAFLWSPRIRPCEKRQSQGNSAFPSWSWASVRGQCRHDDGSDSRRIIPVASWVFLDGNHTVQAPWSRAEDHALDDAALGSIIWRNGCMIEPFPDNLHFKGKIGEYANLFRENWPTTKEFFEACRGIKPDSQERYRLLERFDKEQIEIGRKPGVVLGYSQAVVLTLRPASSHRQFDLCHGRQRIGWFEYDLRPDYSEAVNMLQRGPVELEVFGLSAAWMWKYRGDLSEDEEIDLQSGITEADPSSLSKLQKYFRWTMHVMAIRTSNGISYRMGLGEVDCVEWLKLKRKFKAVVLN